MITCSNCKTNFPITLDNIKGGDIVCPNCLNSCPVTLYQLQEAYEEKGFSGFQEITDPKNPTNDLLKEEKSEEASQLIFHLNLLLIAFIILINLFTIGMMKLDSLEEFSAIKNFYSSLGLTQEIKLSIKNIDLEKDSQGYLVEIKIENLGKKVDLLSDIKIIFYDLYHKEVGELSLSVMQLIKPGISDIKVKVANPSDDITYLALKINDQAIGSKVTIKKQ
jgi:hypothetical protein